MEASMTRLEDYDTSHRFTGIVKQSTRITSEDSEEEVRDIIIEINEESFEYTVGQSIGVVVPGPHEFGNREHFRLYSIANIVNSKKNSNPEISICVKRCSYIDEFNGERYDGVASNYLCDLQPRAELTLTGPYGLPFELPDNKKSNLLMIGLGTGIAPFRAFIKYIYNTLGGWEGKVRLFYGARSGLEMLYMNDEKSDLTNYYDEQTFKAFEAVSPRPHLDDPVALDQSLEKNSKEVWKMVKDPDTHVYVAGVSAISEILDKAFEKMAGSVETWEKRKAEMVAGKRWMEVLY
jgi:ferredoxin--NADP+ reductase